MWEGQGTEQIAKLVLFSSKGLQVGNDPAPCILLLQPLNTARNE